MTIKASGLVGAGSVAPFFNEPIVPDDYIAGKYNRPSLDYSVISAANIVQDTLYFIPFAPFVDHTFDRIAVFNNGASDTGKKVRLGIYDSVGGRPVNLLLDAGEVTLDATAALRTITISQSLTKGVLYFLALVGDGAINIKNTGLLNTPQIPSMGLDDFQMGTIALRILTQSHTYGTLPATVSVTAISTNNPIIHLRG